MKLVDEMLKGSHRALARLVSVVEEEGPDVPQIIRDVQSFRRGAYSVGITGPAGAGKSTIVDRLITEMRAENLSVGAIAADPTSPFSGGAVLGDRIRMQRHFSDPKVFIRSIATRGSQGGLPLAIRNVIKLLDAFGKDVIILETVGTGQTELDIMDSSDTVIVALGPESGDGVQVMKAGLMEIGNVFVVNKADREGADKLLLELQKALELAPARDGWQPPVLSCQAVNDIGIRELYQEIKKHRKFLESTGLLSRQRQRQRREEFLRVVERRFRGRILALMKEDNELKRVLQQVENDEIDPYSGADAVGIDELFQRFLGKR